MSSPSIDTGINSTVSSGNVTTLKLSRLIPTGYAKWKPEAENCFKRGGMKESDYKKEIKGFTEMKKYVETLDDQEVTNAYQFLLKKNQSSSSSSGTASQGTATSTALSVDSEAETHNKKMRGVVERSGKVFAMVYDCLPDEIRLLVNNNKAIVEGYGYSLWKWLEEKYQSTESDSIGKLWNDFVSAKQFENELFDAYKARVDEVVELLHHAGDTIPNALYATILMDRLVPRYNQMKMIIDSSSELGKDRKKMDWVVVTKFIQQQERNLARQSEEDSGDTSAQAMIAAQSGNSYRSAASGGSKNSGYQGNRNASGGTYPLTPTAELPYRGKDGCWCCGLKNHSFRKCRKWLAKKGRTPGNTAPNSRSSSPTGRQKDAHSAAASASSSNSNSGQDGNRSRFGLRESEENYDGNGEKAEKKELFVVMVTAAMSDSVSDSALNSPASMKKKISFSDREEKAYVQKPFASNAEKAKSKSILKVQSCATAAKLKEANAADISDESFGLSNMNWGIDSMASIHITGSKMHLTNIRKGPLMEIKTANNGRVFTDTMGDIKIRMNCVDGETYTFTVSGVYYQECIAANLLSAQKLRAEGFEITLGRYNRGAWMCTPGGQKVRLSCKNDLTILEQNGKERPSKANVNVVYLADIQDAEEADEESPMASNIRNTNRNGIGILKAADDLIRLHHKLGHCAWTTLKRAIVKDVVEGVGKYRVPADEERKALQAIVKCEVCLESAGKCTNYGTRGLDHGSAPGEVLHMDTFYMRVEPTAQFEYGVVVRDPFGGAILVNTHNSRDAETVSRTVIDRIKFLERQLGVKVKRLNADGGGEFINHILLNFCKEKGIAIGWPPKDKHQLNGSAESCVRVVKYGGRKLLIGSGLPDQFWKYAVQHFVFIYNRIYLSKYTGKTPYETLMGKKPSCEHWGIFGCDVKYHIPKGRRPTTFSPTMLSGIYLGHDTWRNCALVYSMSTRKVIYTRDVKYLDSFNYAQQMKKEMGGGLSIEEEQKDFDSEIVEDGDVAVAGSNSKHLSHKGPPLGYPAADLGDADESVRYEVEQIIDHRMRKGKKEYQVRWAGYPIEQSTWQRASQLLEDGCKDSINRYEAVLKGIELDEGKESESNHDAPESKEEIPKNRKEKGKEPDEFIEDESAASLTEDEAITKAIAEAALRAFSSGYERSDTTTAAKVKRSELIMAIASGLAELEKNTPKSYKEAIKCKHHKEWTAAMKVEWDTLVKEDVWEYISQSSLPAGTNILPSKFVFKVKLKENGEIEKFKARLVAGGHKQIHGVDFNEVYASTGKYKTLRIMMSLAAKMGYDLHQMDVPAAFVKGALDEEDIVYMQIPEGYREGREGMVLKLKKSLYGLHQAGRNWYLLAVKFLTKVLGFRQSVSDPSFFYKRSRTGKLMTIFLFVDDFQAGTAPEDREEWNEYLGLLKKEFDIKYLGEPKWLLGMKITRDRKRGLIKLDQELYITKALERFGFGDCRTVDTPEEANCRRNGPLAGADGVDTLEELCDRGQYMEKVGTAIYAAISTRPDICHAVYQCAKHMQKPTNQNMKAVDRIFRYLAGTKKVGLVFGSRNMNGGNVDSVDIAAYSDADWGSNEDRKSLSGWVVKLNGDTISWSCKKQSVVAQSTCEAELYAEAAAINEVLWLKDLIGELDIRIEKEPRLNIREDSGVVVYCDNQSTIKVSKNGIKADRTKHVDIKYHFITDVLNEKKVALKWVSTDRQVADIFTKALRGDAFIKHRRNLTYEQELIEA